MGKTIICDICHKDALYNGIGMVDKRLIASFMYPHWTDTSLERDITYFCNDCRDELIKTMKQMESNAKTISV